MTVRNNLTTTNTAWLFHGVPNLHTNSLQVALLTSLPVQVNSSNSNQFKSDGQCPFADKGGVVHNLCDYENLFKSINSVFLCLYLFSFSCRLLLFVDEADAFLRKRNQVTMESNIPSL